MTKNDAFYKILFAIELALLPMVSFAYVYGGWPTWIMGLFMGGVFVCKIWREIFKDVYDKTHIIIGAVSTVAVYTYLLIFLTSIGYFHPALAVTTIVFVILQSLFKVLMRNKRMPEFVTAVDHCFVIFEAITLLAMSLIVLVSESAIVGLWSLLLTSIVSVSYKSYYALQFYGVIDKIKNKFHRR